MKIQLAPVFTDHAVFQSEKPIHIWGTITDTESAKNMSLPRISILFTPEALPTSDTLSNQIENSGVSDCSRIPAKVNPDQNSFSAMLPPMEAGGPYTLTLFMEDTPVQTIGDIMIGEVWLAGGQSNMEYELQNDADAREYFSKRRDNSELHSPIKGSVASDSAFCDDTYCPNTTIPELSCNVRFYQVPRRAYFDESLPESAPNEHWMTTSDSGLGSWSAVAYYFARELSEKLNCTIGIIGCNWGGTSACAWQSRESLLLHPDTAVYWKEYEEILQRQTPEEYEHSRQEYLAYQEKWQPMINEFYEKNPSGAWEDALRYAGPCLWPGPMGPKHEFRPAGLYETMLRKVTPYSLKGFLYYQGESDDHRPSSYLTLLRSMIAQWRKDFMDESLTFLNVQLPMHRYKGDPASDSWAVIRAAQEQVWREDPNSGLAVIIDQGEFDNIHPTHKKEVGHRLYLQSMLHPYHLMSEDETTGPFLQSAIYHENSHIIELHFEHLAGGFDRKKYQDQIESFNSIPFDPSSVFEYSDTADTFRPLTPEWSEDNQRILLTLPDAPKGDITLRYLWVNYGPVPIFDQRGLPLAPFQICIPLSED